MLPGHPPKGMTQEMLDAGASVLWRLCNNRPIQTKPFEEVNEYTKQVLRFNAQTVWRAMRDAAKKDETQCP